MRPLPAPPQVRPDDQWKAVLEKLVCTGGWISLSDFLKHPAIDEKTHHTMRFLDGTYKKKKWRSSTGHLAVKGRDWTYRATAAGGGAGDGILHCSKEFLKHVFLSHYAK